MQKQEIKKLIAENTGSFANITVRPAKPVVQLVKLHEAHLRMVDADWITKCELLPADSVVEINGNLYKLSYLEKLSENAKKSVSAANELHAMMGQLGWDEFQKAIKRNKKK